METPIKTIKYNMEIWETPEMDKIRRDTCMCLHCGKMKPNTPEHCKIAQSFYEICKQYGNAFIMTRCSQWIDK